MSKLYSVVPTMLIIATSALIVFTVGYIITLILSYYGVLNMFSLLSSPSYLDTIGVIVLGIIISKVLLLITLGLLLMVLLKIRKREPFERSTVHRFYVLGVLVFFMPFAEAIPLLLVRSAGSFSMQLIGYNSMINSISSTLILGIIMFTVACIMHLGFKVSEEQKLTV